MFGDLGMGQKVWSVRRFSREIVSGHNASTALVVGSGSVCYSRSSTSHVWDTQHVRYRLIETANQLTNMSQTCILLLNGVSQRPSFFSRTFACGVRKGAVGILRCMWGFRPSSVAALSAFNVAQLALFVKGCASPR